MSDINHKISIKACLVVAVGALYFFLDAMLAVFPSALTSQVMSKFNVAATGVSLFAGIYFYIYAPLQLPGGLILDKFGPKRIMILGCALCVLALALFAYTNSFLISCIARGLMGLGACAGYLAPMLLVVRWFPHKYYIVMTGVLVLIECIGAVFGGSFLAYLTDYLDLNTIILLMAGLGLFLLLLIIIVVKDYPSTANRAQEKHVKFKWSTLTGVFLSFQNWVIALSGALFWAPVSIFAALWGIPFLQAVHGLSKGMAESLVIFIWVGVGLLSPLWGFFSNYVGRRVMPMQLGAILGLIGSLVIIFYLNAPLVILALALLSIGAASACQVFSFGLMHDRYMKVGSSTAFAFGFNNMIICFGNAFFDYISGDLLDRHWAGQMLNGIKVYSAADYSYALTIMPVCYVVILFISVFFIKETLGRHQYIKD
jgi:MFS family permease